MKTKDYEKGFKAGMKAQIKIDKGLTKMIEKIDKKKMVRLSEEILNNGYHVDAWHPELDCPNGYPGEDMKCCRCVRPIEVKKVEQETTLPKVPIKKIDPVKFEELARKINET